MTVSEHTEETLQAVVTELAEVGDLPGYLARLGCRGSKDSSGHCPIARYLTKLGFQDVEVDNVILHVADGPDGPKIQDVPTPDRLVRFITAFDNGRYPELEV